MKVNKNQCRYCKRLSPAVDILLSKGKPQGECRQCNRDRQLRHRIRANWHLGLYRALPELVAANLKVLATLPLGAYSLERRTLEGQIGYIIVQIDSIFVSLYNDSTLFKYDLFGIAAYLGNLNAFIADPIAAPIDLGSLAGLTPLDVQDRLIWYDIAYQSKALKLLKDDARKAKAVNMAIARVQKSPAD